jgi:hypothetical protein
MAQNNMLTPLQNMPIGQNAPTNWLQNTTGKLKTGKNPNPQFPRARHGWESFKEGLGNFLQGGRNFLLGNPGGVEQYSTVTPNQQNILALLQQLGVEGLENIYSGFEPIEQQARNNFSQQTVPSIAERFSSLGNNALTSPTFATQVGQAGAGLESELAAMKAGYGQQNLQNILQLLQLGLQPQSENVFRPRENGLLQGLVGAAPNFYQSYQLSNALKGLLK